VGNNLLQYYLLKISQGLWVILIMTKFCFSRRQAPHGVRVTTSLCAKGPFVKIKKILSKASLNLKGPFGVTNLKVCSQKIVPIFSFFLFGPAGKNYSFFLPPVGNLPDFGYFNYGPTFTEVFSPSGGK
jgi:hypothetical protein